MKSIVIIIQHHFIILIDIHMLTQILWMHFDTFLHTHKMRIKCITQSVTWGDMHILNIERLREAEAQNCNYANDTIAIRFTERRRRRRFYVCVSKMWKYTRVYKFKFSHFHTHDDDEEDSKIGKLKIPPCMRAYKCDSQFYQINV